MNLKELVSQSLNIEEQLREQFGIIKITLEEEKPELLIHKPKDFLDLTEGKYDFIERDEKGYNENFAGDLKHENDDFKFLCYLRKSEVREFKELTK